MARRSDAPHDLRVGFRGYDRAGTDELIAKLEARTSALSRERDELCQQLNELKRDIDDHR